MKMGAISKLLWLLVLLFGPVVSQSPATQQTPNYDGETRAIIICDDTPPLTVVYDTSLGLTDGKRGIEPSEGHPPCVGPVEFLAAEGTGAFNPAFSGGGNGLGSLLGKEIRVSQRGLDLVERHLAQFGPVEENTMMLDRLRSALANAQKISGGDASFYLHEASEATMMGRGMGYDAAHAAALQKYGVSKFSVYSPEVIQALPGSFNQNWFNFWGLGRKRSGL